MDKEKIIAGAKLILEGIGETCKVWRILWGCQSGVWKNKEKTES